MTDPRLSLEKRMGITMGDAGSSITVTSLTNFGCFGRTLRKFLLKILALGYFLSPTPAVADFCVLTAVGVMMDYAYQITFFAAIMVYGGKREDEGGIKAYLNCRKKTDKNDQIDTITKKNEEEQKTLESWHKRKILIMKLIYNNL